MTTHQRTNTPEMLVTSIRLHYLSATLTQDELLEKIRGAIAKGNPIGLLLESLNFRAKQMRR